MILTTIVIFLLLTRDSTVPVLRPECCRSWDRLGFLGCGVLDEVIVRHLDNHLHVVGLAPSPHSPVDVSVVRCGYEVVFLSRYELQASRSGSEGSEGDGEVHEGLRSVTDCHYPRSGTSDFAVVILLLLHPVDHMLLSIIVSSLHNRTNQIHLVVLPGKIVLINCDYQRLISVARG